MSRYIDADELKNAFTNWREIVNNPYDFFPSVEECKAVIDAQPTAEVTEVKHGRWEHHDDATYAGGGYEECSYCRWRCSEWIFIEDTRYCPNCGSRMDLDGDTE